MLHRHRYKMARNERRSIDANNFLNEAKAALLEACESRVRIGWPGRSAVPERVLGSLYLDMASVKLDYIEDAEQSRTGFVRGAQAQIDRNKLAAGELLNQARKQLNLAMQIQRRSRAARHWAKSAVERGYLARLELRLEPQEQPEGELDPAYWFEQAALSYGKHGYAHLAAVQRQRAIDLRKNPLDEVRFYTPKDLSHERDSSA
jgi:hypothetical protein